MPAAACELLFADTAEMDWWGSGPIDICLEVHEPLNRHVRIFKQRIYASFGATFLATESAG